MSAPVGKVRVLILRDPGFRMGSDDGVSPLVGVLESQPSIRVAEAAAGYGEAGRSVQRSEADLVIVDEVAGDPTAVVEQVDNVAPDVPIIVVLDDDQKAMAQACILAGARAYLFRPFDASELLEVIYRIQQKEERRRRDRSSESPLGGGRIVLVHGAKGGVGATMIATNLAVATQQMTGQRVALVDLSLMGGDVAVALNIASDNSIADVVAHLRELDGDLLEDTMVRHPSGVHVLPSPSQLERAEAITGDETASVLKVCRMNFDVVIVDTTSRLDEHVLAALDLADAVLLICTPEIAALKNTARFLRLGHELGYGTDKMFLVVNRHGSIGAIAVADIEENLRHKMSFALSSDGVPIVNSLNAGEPVVSMRPRSRAARELRRLSAFVARQIGAPIAAHTMSATRSSPGIRSSFGVLSKLRPARAAAR